ncbi:MAG: Aconitate hydratase A [Alphaproteobacteria bacterium MarineAlpha5_Bin9]|nr:MAG: Aconitate hydratase A [Alphaproteobacteria bacterium MarineAlpha5_Bin9]
MSSKNTFKTQNNLKINQNNFIFYDLNLIENKFDLNLDITPLTLKILLENLLRNEDGKSTTRLSIINFIKHLNNNNNKTEINFSPARVLMQDFTGVPAIADLAAMRDKLKQTKIDPKIINPKSRVDLVIDHSVSVDNSGNINSINKNIDLEFKRNKERYEFLKWGQNAFDNFNLVPPGLGICHQVNLESIAKTVWIEELDGHKYVYPDSVVGTDSHTTMVNSLGVLGWGVGGIEAEAVMLGEPLSLNVPEVIGFELNGKMREGVTSTDLVLAITNKLRKHGVVGKFVEFFGDGIKKLSLADRATISNMSPEYGATCGFFPVDQETLNYLNTTGKTDEHIKLVEIYSKKQGLWANKNKVNYNYIIKFDMGSVELSIAGPKRPQDKISLSNVSHSFKNNYSNQFSKKENSNHLKNGDIVIAAITSCTNTSNPNVMIAAGLVAKKAVELGLSIKPHVKTSLAPGSKVVKDYLDKSGLTKYLDILGFNIVGYGCTTCIGNSGPLDPKLSKEIQKNNLIVCSVLSGNRNFEGRIHQEVKANYLASPPLVVAFALAGNIQINLTNDPIAINKNGKKIYLEDLWPSIKEIKNLIDSSLDTNMFKLRYNEIYDGDKNWSKIKINKNSTFNWQLESTYIKKPPFFDIENLSNKDIIDARILAILGDTITTDHISPAGAIHVSSPAGEYLTKRQIRINEFNSYGSRRGNHEIMLRGTFANIRIKNEILHNIEGGITKCFLDHENKSIFEAASQYNKTKVPLIIIAGKEYGTGSSRDWAAKGTKLLGVRAIIAESFERIHRSNLVGMGVLPLEFMDKQNRHELKLLGEEKITIKNINLITPSKILDCEISSENQIRKIKLKCRVDTEKELQYYKSGGILNYILERIVNKVA